jgi:hypothetical protein
MEIDNQLKKLEKRYNTLWNRSWKRNNVPKEEKEALNKEMNVLFSEIEELKKTVRIFDQIRQPIHETISNMLKLRKGEKFKSYVTFQELIDYKTDKQTEWSIKYYGIPTSDDENTRFKRFISFIDELQYNLKFIYPFIDLEGVDLSWTTDKLVEYILDAYFTMPVVTIADIEKKRKEAKRESLADKIVIDMKNTEK